MTNVVGVGQLKSGPASYVRSGEFSLPFKSYVVEQLEKLYRSATGTAGTWN